MQKIYHFTEKFMKNKLIAAILIVLMLVPTVVAVINYSTLSSGKIDKSNTLSVELVDFKGNSFLFKRSGEGKQMMNYFINTIGNAEAVDELPSSVEIGEYFDVFVETSTNKQKKVYKFYYSDVPQACYFTEGDNAYKIKTADAKEFISGSYAACLYENGLCPTLSVSGKETFPDMAEWKFNNYLGAATDYDCSAIVSDTVESITLEGGLSMSFAIEPDDFKIKITDKNSGETVFDDNYSNFAGLTVTMNMNVTVEAVANWYADSQRNYSGSQTYKFDAVFGAPAHFYAGTTDIKIGEFICVTGENVNNVEDITFTSEPDISYSPVFFKDGDYVQALIPFSWNLNAGDYILTFSYGGSTQQINVKLGERASYHTFKDKTITIADSVVKEFGSEEKKAQCESTLREVAKLSSDKRYWTNNERLYYSDETEGFRFSIGFGMNVQVSGTDISFRNTGVDFAVAQGTDVVANLGGEVIFADYLPYSGYTVVIEHGYGLKTWYAHLGSKKVEKGDIVEKGDLIGTTGNASFTDKAGVHIGLTIFDVPVCQYALWTNSDRPGDLAGIVMYEAK